MGRPGAARRTTLVATGGYGFFSEKYSKACSDDSLQGSGGAAVLAERRAGPCPARLDSCGTDDHDDAGGDGQFVHGRLAEVTTVGGGQVSGPEIRCGACRKKLGEGIYARLIIKCPRCGALNSLRATSPEPERHRASNPEGTLNGNDANSKATANSASAR